MSKPLRRFHESVDDFQAIIVTECLLCHTCLIQVFLFSPCSKHFESNMPVKHWQILSDSLSLVKPQNDICKHTDSVNG